MALMNSVKLESPINDELLMRRRYASSADNCGMVCFVAGALTSTVFLDLTPSKTHIFNFFGPETNLISLVILLLLLLLLGRPSSKNACGSVVSNRIGMKFVDYCCDY